MNYSIILYNNTLKTSAILNYDEQGDSSLFYHFRDVDIECEDGEYTYYLVPNRFAVDIEVNTNAPFKSTMGGMDIEVEQTGLLRIGTPLNKSTNKVYDIEKQYKQYNG